MKSTKEIFSKNLRNYASLKNYSQRELAQKINVSAPTMNDYFHARKFPRMDRVQKLADVLNVRTSDLLEAPLDQIAGQEVFAADAIIKKIIDLDLPVSSLEKLYGIARTMKRQHIAESIQALESIQKKLDEKEDGQ